MASRFTFLTDIDRIKAMLASVLMAGVAWVMLYSGGYQTKPTLVLSGTLFFLWLVATNGLFTSLKNLNVRVVLLPLLIGWSGTFTLIVVLTLRELWMGFGFVQLPLTYWWGFAVFNLMAFLINGLLVFIDQMDGRTKATYQALQMQQQLNHDANVAELQYRFQPHFLYNSLNTVNALVGIDVNRARKVVIGLSDLLRRSVTQTNAQFHPLAEEVKILEQYLMIELERFGDRLEVSWQRDPQADQIGIPPFLLQPVVENAIKYGLYGTIDQVNIEIRIAYRPSDILISVSNPYSEEGSKTKPMGTNSGLAILRKRLLLTYGRQDLLNCKAENGIFTTAILLPIISRQASQVSQTQAEMAS